MDSPEGGNPSWRFMRRGITYVVPAHTAKIKRETAYTRQMAMTD